MKKLREKYAALKGCLDEARLRWWAAAEARSLGHGGVTCVAKATGLNRRTLHRGLREVTRRSGKPSRMRPDRVRRPGGGRKPLTALDSKLSADLEALVDPYTRGDSRSPLRWTCKSTAKLATELNRTRHRVSSRSVSKLLTDLDYSLQAMRKTREGSQHRDRDAQFRHISRRALEFQAAGQPVVSVDTKKKELIGDFKNGGREWRPKGEPERVRVHDFIDPEKGKAVPYGVYDVALNTGWVSVGISHDTASFAVNTIRTWWNEEGIKAYPRSTSLMIVADGGGSNGSRVRLWKWELQQLATATGLTIHVSHLPPGTSKWNKIEHRLFSFISRNWRGQPLLTHATIVKLIANTTTTKGLKVRCILDKRYYPSKLKVTDEQMESLCLIPKRFHGDWNYSIRPVT